MRGFGEAIRTARKATPRWTQGQLAERAGVDVETIVRAEKGDPGLKFATLASIASALDVKTGGNVLAEIARALPPTKPPAQPADTDTGADQGSTQTNGESSMAEDPRQAEIAELIHTFRGLPRKHRDAVLTYAHERAAEWRRRAHPGERKKRAG